MYLTMTATCAGLGKTYLGQSCSSTTGFTLQVGFCPSASDDQQSQSRLMRLKTSAHFYLRRASLLPGRAILVALLGKLSQQATPSESPDCVRIGCWRRRR